MLDNFYTRYCEAMENVEAQDTSAKKLKVHQEISRKLDDSIKGQTWRVRFSILDVKNTSRGFEIQLDKPEETPNFSERWNYRTSVTNLKLSKQQGLELKPGDILVLAGTPRFSIEPSNTATAVFSRYLEVADRTQHHSIHLTNHSFSIVKGK